MKGEMLSWLYKKEIPRELFLYYVGIWTTLTSRFPIGTNIYERDWDALLLLDTCRIDALREVGDEYEFLSDISALTSVGSTSNEWIANTFTKAYYNEIKETAYISANGYVQRVIEDRIYPEVHMNGKREPPHWARFNVVKPNDFLLIDQPWRYAPDDSPGEVLPSYITDRAVAVGRAYDPERLIVHYSQPHAPYIANAVAEGRSLEAYEESPFQALRNGIDKEIIWRAYLDNLRIVLDEVEILLENLNAETVIISADHGEAFGKYGMYGHLPGMLHPHVKRVPWARTSAFDSGEFEPTLDPKEKSESDVEEHLRALGYK